MSLGPKSTYNLLEADESTRIKRCNCFPHYKRKNKKQSHHTVDITLTNDRSLLNFVFLTGSPVGLASIGERSTSAAAW